MKEEKRKIIEYNKMTKNSDTARSYKVPECWTPPWCLEYFEMDFSGLQCSRGKFQLEILAGALRLTVNQCGKVPPNLININKGMTARAPVKE
jgi:hypothetical protein